MKLHHLLALMLALVLLLVPATGCAPEPTTPPADGEQTPTDPSEQEPSDDEEKPFDVRAALEALPACGFADEEFLIAAASSFEGNFVIDQFPLNDAKTGALVQDALYDRDALLEEVLGISLVYDDMYDSVITTTVGTAIRSGDDIYSLVLGNLAYVSLSFFNNDLLYDLNEVPHVDLTAAWWNKNTIDNFEFNDRIYMASGAITNRSVYAPYAMLFNQQLLADASLESPYDLIDRNEWTMEMLATMIEDTYVDLNTDDEVDLGDFFGLAPASDSETAYYFASGATFSEKTEDGGLILTHLEDDNIAILEEVIALYDTDDVLKYRDTYDSIAAFRESRAIFHSMALGDITMLNEMSDPYGIVPMPKHDEYQDEFYSNANRYIATMALIPYTVADIDNVGLIVEAMAMASHYISLEAQYEQVLLNRQALDAQSKQNLIAVVESTTFDMSYAFDFCGMVNGLRPIINGGKSYASYYAAYTTQLDEALDEFLLHFNR